MRKRNVSLIILTVFLTTAATFFSGLYFTDNSLIETMEQDLAFAISIADDLVSNRVQLIKSTAVTISLRLRSADGDEKLADLMREEYESNAGIFEVFGLTVFDGGGIIESYSEPQHIHDVNIEPEHLEMVHNGRTIISSPFYCSVTNEFVMNVFTPFGPESVLAVTIPGLTFSDLLADHQLWQSGHIFMLDEEGTFIGSANQEIVLGMSNFATGLADPAEQEEGKIGGLIRSILTTERGVYRYSFEGDERICAYSLINDTVLNWHVAVTVLLKESPQSDALTGHMYAAVLSLFTGTVAAFLLAKLVEQPYRKIEDQNRELEVLMRDVEKANHAKSEFLAKMSHEMRTPLNAVIGLSEITLGSKGLDRDAKTNLEKVYNSGYTLLSIVNDVLDISKIQSGKFEIIPVCYDLPSLINDTVIQNALRIGSKPVRFILHIDENLPAQLTGDELRVKQIVNNLLSNAIKYTDKGEVTLSFNCENGDSGDVWLTIRVRDTGIGILPKNLETLFDEYTQFVAAAGHRSGGTGLGLSITKSLAEMMDGEISVESEYGKGSTFTAKIKQKYVNGSVIGSETAENLRNFHFNTRRLNNNSFIYRVQLPDARVLVVDDNITNLDVAKGILKPYGMRVDGVISGLDAVRVVAEGTVKYDAIFMDHMMPGIDGIEAVRRIRNEIGTEYAKTVPIIALTANAIVGNEEMFLSRGFDGFISKPIDLSRLDEVIRKYLRGKGKETPDGLKQAKPKEEEKSGPGLLELAINIKGINIGAGLEMYGGEKAYMQILRSFAVNTKQVLEAMEDVTKDRLADYAVSVHGLKGASRNICADPLSARAQELEDAAKTGDWTFTRTHNPDFITSVFVLISEINTLLKKYSAAHPKQKKNKPGAEELAKLRLACAAYDFSEIEKAMDEIESYEYTADNGLTEWLRENIIQMNIPQVAEKLEALSNGEEW